MDERRLIAYLLLVVLATILLFILHRVTREWRAHSRARRAAMRRARERIEDAADRS